MPSRRALDGNDVDADADADADVDVDVDADGVASPRRAGEPDDRARQALRAHVVNLRQGALLRRRRVPDGSGRRARARRGLAARVGRAARRGGRDAARAALRARRPQRRRRGVSPMRWACTAGGSIRASTRSSSSGRRGPGRRCLQLLEEHRRSRGERGPRPRRLDSRADRRRRRGVRPAPRARPVDADEAVGRTRVRGGSGSRCALPGRSASGACVAS